MNIIDLTKALNSSIFSLVVMGLLFLLGVDFLYVIFTTGKPNQDLEKEIIGLLGILIGHQLNKNTQNVDKV